VCIPSVSRLWANHSEDKAVLDYRREESLADLTRPLRALVVEDDPDLLAEMMRFMRTEMRFDPLGAYDYSGALIQLEHANPDFVSIDLTLPRESGFELCEYIRRRPRSEHVPILVTREAPLPEDMAHAEEAGANLFLEKPFGMRDLATHITALIEKPKVSRPGLRFLRLF
jgi:DNA-binding response OmpR family regulator